MEAAVVADNDGDDVEAKMWNVETLQQRAHELSRHLRRIEEERDNVVAENEELQEHLEMSYSAQSAGNARTQELRNEINKITEDISRVEYACSAQENELKTLCDKMGDLNCVKETVKDLVEDAKQFKEDFSRMRTHLNVTAKLELQTQEKMYESRLHHLENVLEEMRQREGHFMRLAEETAVLKDQVDTLRELSVVSLKNDHGVGSGSGSAGDAVAEANAAIAVADAARYGALVASFSGSSLPRMLLSRSTSSLSDENTLAKEMLADGKSSKVAASDINLQTSANIDFTEKSKLEENLCSDSQVFGQEEGELASSEYDNAKLMLLDVEENPTLSPKAIRVSGTLMLTQSSAEEETGAKKSDEIGCFPRLVVSVWSCLFD